MSDTLRTRLANVESGMPRPVLLTLDDGTVFRYEKGPLKLINEVLVQVYEKSQTGREGPLLDIVARAVKSEGFGTRMLELAKVMLAPADCTPRIR